MTANDSFVNDLKCIERHVKSSKVDCVIYYCYLYVLISADTHSIV